MENYPNQEDVQLLTFNQIQNDDNCGKSIDDEQLIESVSPQIQWDELINRINARHSQLSWAAFPIDELAKFIQIHQSAGIKKIMLLNVSDTSGDTMYLAAADQTARILKNPDTGIITILTPCCKDGRFNQANRKPKP